jgi:hypothetical protein
MGPNADAAMADHFEYITDPEIRELVDKYWALSRKPTLDTQAFVEARGSMIWLDMGRFICYIMRLERQLVQAKGH